MHTLTAKSTISYVSCWRMEQQCVLTFLLYPILWSGMSTARLGR
ncbi:hypothetical protein I313_03584 [Cryptococcus deuterogattii Ram5]|uniref:Uncharacterized protein n=1 Tax=Cryptococcus deuterogattii Ram5 TaxID=1296110 RepID=A0A0D0T3D2_9TREE|nr:hypothetical protein I313_03584 [Cryptococcus deuterogattii Ram5]KIR99804.1 hypothetical protein L804_02438 [Cryptococcus deuterogattii 2001/935-1]